MLFNFGYEEDPPDGVLPLSESAYPNRIASSSYHQTASQVDPHRQGGASGQWRRWGLIACSLGPASYTGLT